MLTLFRVGVSHDSDEYKLMQQEYARRKVQTLLLGGFLHCYFCYARQSL